MIRLGNAVKRVVSLRCGVLAAFAATLLLFGPAAAAADAQRSIEYFEAAHERLKIGQVRAAIIELKNALQQNPDNVDARFLLGTTHLRVGDGASAEKELRVARKLGFAEERILGPLGRAYLLQGKYKEVLDNIQGGTRGDAVEANVLVIRGSAHLGLKQLKEAKAAFVGADKRRPDYAPTKFGLAQILVVQRKLKEAEEYVDRALAISPDMAQALVLKGELRRIARDRDGALVYFNKAIAANADNLLARLGRAAALIDQNRDEEGRAEVESIRQRIPRHPLAAYLSARIYAKARDFAKAESELLETRAALDNHMPSVYLRGVVSYAQGHYEQAMSNMRRYINSAPRHVSAYKILGAALLRMGEGGQAAEALQPALELAPDDAQLLALTGNAMMQARRFTEANEYFERAAMVAPGSAGVRTQLAVGRLAAGEPEQAVAELEAALENDPEATRPGILLALTHLRTGKFDKALEAIERLEARLTDNPLPHNLRGAALIGKSDIAGARASFEKALAIKGDFFPATSNLARLDMREGRAEDAEARYRKTLEGNESHLGALMGLVDLALAERQTDEAIALLEKAGDRNPSASLPRLRLVDVFIAARQPEKALGVARDLADLAPNNARALDALARAQLTSGDAVAAAATYRQVISLSPRSAEANRRLAEALNAAGDEDAARNAFEQAITLDPGLAPAYQGLVRLDLKAGRADAALERAKAFVAVRPENPIGDMLMGDVLFEAKRFAEAAKVYQLGIAKKAGNRLAVKLYNARVRAGEEASGLAGLEDWMREHPADNTVRLVLGGAYIKAKRFDEATYTYEKLNDSGRPNAVVLNNLAWLYHQKGDERALEFGEKALELAPEAGAILDTVGWILVERGQAERALPLLEKAKTKMPESPDVLYHYAAVLMAVGRPKEALPYLRNIFMLYGDFESAPAAKKLLDEISGG